MTQETQKQNKTDHKAEGNQVNKQIYNHKHKIGKLTRILGKKSYLDFFFIYKKIKV